MLTARDASPSPPIETVPCNKQGYDRRSIISVTTVVAVDTVPRSEGAAWSRHCIPSVRGDHSKTQSCPSMRHWKRGFHDNYCHISEANDSRIRHRTCRPECHCNKIFIHTRTTLFLKIVSISAARLETKWCLARNYTKLC